MYVQFEQRDGVHTEEQLTNRMLRDNTTLMEAEREQSENQHDKDALAEGSSPDRLVSSGAVTAPQATTIAPDPIMSKLDRCGEGRVA